MDFKRSKNSPIKPRFSETQTNNDHKNVDKKCVDQTTHGVLLNGSPSVTTSVGSVDDPETIKNQCFNSILKSESDDKCDYNEFINQTYQFNFDKSSKGKGFLLHPDQLIDEEKNEDIKPLLSFEETSEKKKPKSIVKSPSTQSFSSENVLPRSQRPRLSLQTSQNDSTGPSSSGENDRHVQFVHPNLNRDIPPFSLENNKNSVNGCRSPLGSITSRSSATASSSSSSSDENSSLGQYAEATPPDGGWGWVVVFASFMVNLIADGITFSFGVLFVEFLNYFEEDRAKTAWIGSLFMAMPLLSGPIASFLTDRYGCRKVTIAGSILASTGFVLSAFANSMEMLFFTFGILAGFGLSLCYVAAVVIVAYYFDKKRSFATGLSVCGSGIGTFLFAPFIQFLIVEYGWRGATLILAGVFLNMMVCGMLMRDLEWTTHKHKQRKKKIIEQNLAISAESFSVSASTNTNGTGTNMQNQTIGDDDVFESRQNDNNEQIDDPRLFSSLITLPTFIRNGEKVPVEVLELLSSHRNVHNVLLQQYPGLLHSRSFSEPLSSQHGLPQLRSPNNFETNVSHKNHQEFLKFLRRQESNPKNNRPNSSYLKDIRMHRHSLTYRGAMLNINRYRLRASSCPDIYRNSMTTIAKEKTQWFESMVEFKNLFAAILDFSYFADIRFLLFAVSNFLLYTWYDVPYVFLSDNAIGMGFKDTDASMLISIIGIVNMFGEIILGWAGDQKWISATFIYAISMGMCGAVTALVPLMKTYTSLGVISGAFGLFIAANYSLTSIILVEIITIERFTNAYGLLLLVQGIANLGGPPLAGYIYDITGTYDLSFYLSGFFIALSGGLFMVLPIVGKYKKYQAAKEEKRKEALKAANGKDIPNGKCNGTTILSDCFGKDILKDGDKKNQV